MLGKQTLYLGLSVLGLLGTWYFNVQFILESDGGFSAVEFVSGGFVNAASSSISIDLAVVAVAAIIWMISESKRLKIPYVWLYIILIFSIALAFAFPLFLFSRERALEKSVERPA